MEADGTYTVEAVTHIYPHPLLPTQPQCGMHDVNKQVDIFFVSHLRLSVEKNVGLRDVNSLNSVSTIGQNLRKMDAASWSLLAATYCGITAKVLQRAEVSKVKVKVHLWCKYNTSAWYYIAVTPFTQLFLMRQTDCVVTEKH